MRPAVCALAALTTLAACAHSPRMDTTGSATTATPRSAVVTPGASGLPADAATARARIDRSPRHGEWAMVRSGGDSVRAWVVYPERATKAPVVLVVHEIFGLSSWVRAVADQLAADGFIAIAPDLLTGKAVPGAPDSLDVQAAVAQIRQLDPAEVQRRLSAVAEYGMGLPAAERRYGIVGFCWGGSTVFAHAAAAPTLGAGVAYYGGVDTKQVPLARSKAPVLGLYGENDARVNATIPAADSALKQAGVPWQYAVYEGAGHGFLRQQDGQGGANLAASRQAWPRTIAWFRQHLER
jgi:carboxymethylenebutenolidase